jgi:lipid-A-disaccharide synthase
MKLMISAGETSGDRLGAWLMAEVRKRRPGVFFFGMGGPRMESEGLERRVRAEEVTVVGLFEVLGKLPRVLRAHRELLAAARREKPSAAVLVDFPDFHFRLGRSLSRMGVPVIYYVSPQVWAWRPGRVARMKDFVRRMITLFPFETETYRRAGIDAVFAGHPLVDEVAARLAGAAAPKRDPSRRRIVLMPGSRKGEVRRHWPVLRDAVRRLSRELPVECFAVPAPDIADEAFGGADEAGIELYRESAEPLLASCDLLMVSSGTATLQGALCGAPMIVIYKTSAATFALARRLVRVPNIALANIVAGERVAPELLQDEATAERVAREARTLLGEPEAAARMREKWRSLRKRLGPAGAAGRAAEAVLEVVPA